MYYIPTFSPHLSKPVQTSERLLALQQQRVKEGTRRSHFRRKAGRSGLSYYRNGTELPGP